MNFPITLVKGEETAVCEHAVHLAAWLKSGWKVKEDKPKSDEKPKMANLTPEAKAKIEANKK